MNLAIVRHGKAKPDSPSGRDADRELAKKGRLQAQWLGKTLAESDFEGSRVLTSPAARALATAEILAGEIGSEIEEAGDLMLGFGVTEIAPLIEAHLAVETLIIVGHNPAFSRLASLLTNGNGRCEVHLRTGEAAIVRLDRIEPGAGELVRVVRMSSGGRS